MEILHIDEDTLLKKNDDTEKRLEDMKSYDRSGEDEPEYAIPDADQVC